jgi:CRISPR-associated endonuclease Csy4
MDYYLDINQKGKQLATNWWLNKVYSKLHTRLYDLKTNSIGVSFPQYKLVLGAMLRLHGTKADLQQLMQQDWLADLAIQCSVSKIELVPSTVEYQIVSRKCVLMSEAKLRRLIKRGSISQDDAKKYRIAMYQKTLTDNPYLELESASSGQKYRRYLQFTSKRESVIGKFDSFGLSTTATVPVFKQTVTK